MLHGWIMRFTLFAAVGIKCGLCVRHIRFIYITLLCSQATVSCAIFVFAGNYHEIRHSPSMLKCYDNLANRNICFWGKWMSAKNCFFFQCSIYQKSQKIFKKYKNTFFTNFYAIEIFSFCLKTLVRATLPFWQL